MKKIIILFCFLICHFCLLANISINFFQADSIYTTNDSTYSIGIKPLNYISDFEHLFTDEQLEKLNATLNRYDLKSTNEISIVTLESIPINSDFDQFSISLFNQWGIGKADSNNGLLILISKNLRKVRITTGFGTEQKLKDEFCKQIIDEILIPNFKQGDYYSGIKKAIQKIIDKWKQ